MNAARALTAVNAAPHALPTGRIGSVCWWSAPEAIEVDPVALTRAMGIHCPDHAKLVREPVAPWSAARRAVRRRSSTGATKDRSAFWREVGEDGDDLIIAYAEETTDVSTKSYKAGDVFAVTVHKTSGALTNNATSLPAAAQSDLVQLMKRYALERGFLTDQDLRDLFIKVLMEHAGGVRIKAGGALFMIPAPYDGVIDQLSAALTEAKTGIDLLRFPVMAGDAATVSQLHGPVRASLTGEARALAEEAKQRLADMREGKRETRYGTMEERMDAVAHLRARAKLFAELLKDGLDDVDAAAADADAAIAEVMRAITGSLDGKGA